MLSAVVIILAGCRQKTIVDEIVDIFQGHSAGEISLNALKEALDAEGGDALESFDKYASIVTPGQRFGVMAGNFGRISGIGVSLADVRGSAMVKRVLADSPAGRVGIKKGDRIVKINGTDVRKRPAIEISRYLRGPENSILNVEVERGKKGGVLEFPLSRRIVRIPNVFSKIFSGSGPSLKAEGRIGYIRIARFSSGTADILEKKVRELSESRIKALIIDLRRNHGGTVEDIVGSLKIFIGGESGLFHTESRHAGYSVKYNADKTAPFPDIPMAVLVDGQTMSGAEVFAASLSDNGRARLVGVTTFGRASVQKVFRLKSGRGLKLTVCMMVPPSGAGIEGSGLKPDIILPGKGSRPSLDLSRSRSPSLEAEGRPPSSICLCLRLWRRWLLFLVCCSTAGFSADFFPWSA